MGLLSFDRVSLKSYFWGLVFLVFYYASLITETSVWFMGIYSLILAFFQFSNYGFFIKAIQKYDFVASRNLFYAKIYPFLELFAGSLFVLGGIFVLYDLFPNSSNLLIQSGALIALIFSLTSFVGVSKILAKRRIKRKVSCACFGKFLETPVNFVTFIEFGLMTAMAILHLFGFI